MENMAVSTQKPRMRGVGRGSRFSVLDRKVWKALWKVDTANRLNLVTVFLVLLAGTGADHRLTKWSAKACEQYAGMGKPRAKRAIDELVAAGLISRTEASTALAPQYLLPSVDREAEPIFLPVQLVTGFGVETPLLRRVRETGDPLLLRMLIEFYGAIQLDASCGLPLSMLRECPGELTTEARKVAEVGANAVWALALPEQKWTSGDWINPYCFKTSGGKIDANSFWERVGNLVRIGGIWFEPWLMDGADTDAEPLFPIDPFSNRSSEANVSELTQIVNSMCETLIDERTWKLERNADRFLVVLPVHHRAPALRGIAKLRVEADSPGSRVAYAKRMTTIERQMSLYRNLETSTSAGRFDRPLGYSGSGI